MTGFQQGQVQAWDKEGISQTEIAKRVGKSRKAIQTFLKARNAYNETHAGGRPPKMSPADSRRLLREASKGEKSAGTLTRELELPISKRRAQQILSGSPLLKYRKAKIAPPLTPMHREKRLQWARERAGWNMQKWGQVIFSDEKKFNLDGPDGLSYYWHDLRKDEKILSRRQMGGGSLMIWGAFSERGTSTLAIISGRQNSTKYIATLENYLLPFAEEMHSNGSQFQQDNASIHTSKLTDSWFTAKDIDVMIWPARSPDLNPIENVWGLLARAVYGGCRQFRTVDELRAAVLEEWAKLDRRYLYALVKSMHKRCLDVIEASGRKTLY